MVKYLLLISVFLYVNCTNNKIVQTEDEIVLNDIFLDLVGTHGYYGSLIPLPPTGEDTSYLLKNPMIYLDSERENLGKWKSQILYHLDKENDLNTYQDMVDSYFANTNQIESLDINNIVRTGRYTLLKDENPAIKNRVGSIKLSPFIYDKKKQHTIFVVVITTGPKAGWVKLITADKQIGIWKISNEELMEVW